MAEILRLIPRDLTSSPTMAHKVEWIATAATLAGLGGSVASSIFGGRAARKAAQKARKENTFRSNTEKAWYDKEYNTDYLDTKAGANLLRRAQEVQDNYVRKADGAAAVGGGTAASVAQAKESANKTLGDAVSNIAASDTSRKQHVSDQHQANVSQLSRERQQIEEQRAQNTSNAAQNASNALMSAGVTLMGSSSEDGKSLSNNTSDTKATTNDNRIVTKVDRDAHSAAAEHLAESAMSPEERNKYRMEQAVGKTGIMG